MNLNYTMKSVLVKHNCNTSDLFYTLLLITKSLGVSLESQEIADTKEIQETKFEQKM